ncbi:MAG: hypothetical protein LBF87_01645 [Treponema sp.]|jgi:hypothetical protein|nr:hypothetical protein [Treponema sp.]
MNDGRKLFHSAGAAGVDNTNVVTAGKPDGVMLRNPRFIEKPAHIYRRGLLCLALALGMASSVSAQTDSKGGAPDWVHGFFLDIGLLGNYEHVEPPEGLRFENGFLLFEIGGGYDFGRITLRLFGNFSIPIDGVVYSSSRTTYAEDVVEVSDTKFGIEGAFKIIDTPQFDVLLPLGAVFSTTEYTEKGNAYDRTWLYEYTSIVSGLYFTVQMTKHLKLCVLPRLDLHLVRNFTYKEVRQGDVEWETESSTYSLRSNTDSFTFSTGLGLRFNL